jgi:hypothetical protein
VSAFSIGFLAVLFAAICGVAFGAGCVAGGLWAVKLISAALDRWLK